MSLAVRFEDRTHRFACTGTATLATLLPAILEHFGLEAGQQHTLWVWSQRRLLDLHAPARGLHTVDLVPLARLSLRELRMLPAVRPLHTGPPARPAAAPVAPPEPAPPEDYDVDLRVTAAPLSNTASAPLPDAFYTLSPAELQHFHAAAARSAQALRDAPLQSRPAAERAAMQRALAAHPLTRVRFRFPDGLQVERNFCTTDAVAVLHRALASTLPGLPAFELCTGPPLRRLAPGDTLLALRLYPAANINVTFQAPGVSARALVGPGLLEPAPGAKRSPSPLPEPTADAHAFCTKASRFLRLHK